jgi:type I restriction enzyme S subunit
MLLPPKSVQEKVAQAIEGVEQKIQAEQSKADALGTLFQTLLHYLMTGKVRVHDLPAFSFVGDAHVPRQ